MSTHNICFYREMRKILCGDPLLTGAMIQRYNHLLYKPSLLAQLVAHLTGHQEVGVRHGLSQQHSFMEI